MGDDRAEGASAVGDTGQAATLLTADVDGTYVHIVERFQLKDLYVEELL